MGSFSIGHWLIVFLIAALVFGPKRLAELGGGLGKGIRAFRDGASGGGDEGGAGAGAGAGATPKGEISGSETKQG